MDSCPSYHLVGPTLIRNASTETDTPGEREGSPMGVHATPGFNCWVHARRQSNIRKDGQDFTLEVEYNNMGIRWSSFQPTNLYLSSMSTSSMSASFHVNHHHFRTLYRFRRHKGLSLNTAEEEKRHLRLGNSLLVSKASLFGSSHLILAEWWLIQLRCQLHAYPHFPFNLILILSPCCLFNLLTTLVSSVLIYLQLDNAFTRSRLNSKHWSFKTTHYSDRLR